MTHPTQLIDRMRLAPEGAWQMIIGTVLLGGGVWGAAHGFQSVGFWLATIPLVLVWGWSIAFFRDPKRVATFAADELCAPADGTVQDITHLNSPPAGGLVPAVTPIDGPAIRIGVFLSLFDVHINRSPCSGTVRSVTYRKGRFLAAMNPEAGNLNESNTLVIDPHPPLKGPVIVRQVAGMAARRIICHAAPGTSLATGERFGLIKYGSRTELIVPAVEGTEVLVKVGDKVRAGLTPLVRQPRRSSVVSRKSRRFPEPSRDREGAVLADIPVPLPHGRGSDKMPSE